MKVLNLGAGKIDRSRWLRDESLKEKDDFVIHVDRYFDPESSLTIAQANEAHRNCGIRLIGNTQILCKSDLFEFIDKFQYKFDLVVAERIFEHMEYVGGEIGRLLEGINMLTNENAQLEIVVPNSILLAKMILEYEVNNMEYTHTRSLNTKLIINTECVNCKNDPHGSIWTPVLAKEYIESEGTWKIDNIEEQIKFAGRDIYMRIKCSKT